MHFEQKVEFFLMFLQYTNMFSLTRGQKNFRKLSQIVFVTKFLVQLVQKFSKTVRRPVNFLIFMRYLCVSNVYLMLGETYFGRLQLET